MNLNPYWYLFIRQDLSLADQLCQTNHATFEMAYTLPQSVDDPITPSTVLIGVPSKKALERVISKLKFNNIDHSAFYESDDDMGLSAVATVPLSDEQRSVLQGYKLWKEDQCLHARSSVGRAPLQSDGGPSFESVRAYQCGAVECKSGMESVDA